MKIRSSYLNRGGDVGYLGKEKIKLKIFGGMRIYKVFRIEIIF